MKTWMLPAAALVAALLLTALGLRPAPHAPAPPSASDGGAPRPVVLLTAFSILDAARYQQAFVGFERRTGIEVTVRAAGGDFADHVYVATPGFEPPDIAVFAQPGLFREMVRSGHVLPLAHELASTVERDFPAALDPLLVDAGRHHGVWMRVAIKNLVWYRRTLFARHGYAVPATAEAMDALTDRMRRDGQVPWCIGLAARGATGWVATDWVETFVLQDAGPEVYDRWAAQRLPFDSPPVRAAFDRWMAMVRTPGMVDRGPAGLLATHVEEAARRFASTPAPCLMMRNAEWLTAEFPPSLQIGPDGDIDFFVLPGHAPARGAETLLVAGDIAGALNARPETAAVMAYLASAEFARSRAAVGSYLSAHREVQPADYADPLSARLAQTWRDAAVRRMDASDGMPPALGTAAFWTGMVDLLRGRPTVEVAAAIDAVALRGGGPPQPPVEPLPVAPVRQP